MLPSIPVVDAEGLGDPALAVLHAEPARAARLLDSAVHTYTRAGLVALDRASRLWAGEARTPYSASVARIDRLLGRPGAYFLNYSYEWACTTGAMPDGDGMALLRTLDWPFRRLGECVVVARQRGDAGAFLNVTWPGFAGVLTAMAPGRFAAAINQPPLRFTGLGLPGDWLVSRVHVARSRAIPPSHLLRHIFETCADYDAALVMLRSIPLCIPAIFTLTGTSPGEAAVIERTETGFHVAPHPIAANHWVAATRRGRPRTRSSAARRAAMAELVRDAAVQPWSFAWLRPPILERTTRLAVVADARTGRLAVQGWEAAGRATETRDLTL